MSTSSESESAAGEPWHPTKRQVIAGVIAIVALLAIAQNTRKGEFNFLLFDFEAPVWVWALANFGAGVATGLLIAHRRARRSSRRT